MGLRDGAARDRDDRIDFVAWREGPGIDTNGDLSYGSRADNFPSGTVTGELLFPTSRFGAPPFDEYRTRGGSRRDAR